MANQVDEAALKAAIAEEITAAESYARSELTPDREKAINYYNGQDLPDVPFAEGRSKYISRDTSNVVNWVLPDIIRVFTASDRIVDCLPETEDDEETSEQAADYLNFCFWRDNTGYQIMWDATWDSLVNKDGIVKQFWEIKEDCKYSTYTGLDEGEVAVLLADEGVELIDISKPYSEMIPVEMPVEPPVPQAQPNPLVDLQSPDVGAQQDQGGQTPPDAAQPMPGMPMDQGAAAQMGGGDQMQGAMPEGQETPQTETQMQPVMLYDIKIKRTVRNGKLTYRTVAPENFGTDPNAIDLVDNWRFQYEKCVDLTRSDLIKMGFDRDRVDAIPSFSSQTVSPEDIARRHLITGMYDSPSKENDRVTLYECYVKMDINDDGMAEIVKVMYAGDNGGGEILDWEEWDDETPYDKIPCNPIPHRMASDSLADEVTDIQKFKTVLGRQMFDNVYQANSPQPVVLEKNVLNMDAVVNRQIGVPIIVKSMDAIRWDVTPFIGDKVLMAMQHLDEVIEMRTGVSRSSMSLDPGTLQNQTATAVQTARDSAHSQVELIARNQAELGWKRVFQKSLKIIAKNQDRPRTIRLRDKWVPMDPRQWNTGMDIVINVGLGTGSRDRDMAMLNSILRSQIMIADRFATNGFTDKAIDMLPKINKTLIKIAEAAGIKSPETYYPEASPAEIESMKQQAQAAAGQGDPKVAAAQAKMQADMDMQKAELDLKSQEMQLEHQHKQAQLAADMQIKREQIAMESQLKREQMAAEIQLQREMALASLHTQGRGIMNDVRLGGQPG